ncbi:protein kinase domain-containing protein [Nocardia cyriacigeorgica]|uniref:protein kinase domain-containing protein n=1 Tax=Nocardia cyriacigeorgica TaxID=135487 RepID=UPI002453DCDF|nr:protein kinase [Nocardia cyriacigeorgica]
MVLQSGDEFGGFVIDRPLGSGGMGVVYLARHPRLERRVALKVLNDVLATDPKARIAFEREVTLAARFDHPNIVAVYDRSDPGDPDLWLSMQYISGGDANALLAADPDGLAPDLAVDLIADAADALDTAHGAGVLHRDVKPANLLIAPDPRRQYRAVLTDFGIARALDESVTASTLAVTFAYAAPERFLAQPSERRTDVYSLGCTLHHLLTGQRPFPRDTHAAVMAAHLNDPPPRPSVLRPDLPAALDAVIATALAKRPDDRYRSCGELAAAARAALAGTPSVAVGVAEAGPTIGDPAPASARAHTAPPPYPPDATTAPSRDSPSASGLPSPRRRPERSSQSWRAGTAGRRKVASGAAVIVAVLTMVVAAAIYLPGLIHSDGDSAAQQPPPQPTTSQPTQIPPGFVPPPVRPTPLPDPVYCRYKPDGKEPRVKRPDDGPVSSKGSVRATINTNAGAIPLLLDRSLAPCTVNSFISLAEQGAFDRVRCAGGRVEWIACGNSESPGYDLDSEAFIEVQYRRGYLMMSSLSFFGATFSLLFADGQLNPEYTVFGTISDEGLKVIDSLIPPDYDGRSERLSNLVFNSIDIEG